MTIQSIVVEVLVILEVLYFFKRISISMPRKSPVKIAHLCKNVLAGQPLAVEVILLLLFFVTNYSFFFFFFNFLKPFSTRLQYNNNNTVFFFWIQICTETSTCFKIMPCTLMHYLWGDDDDDDDVLQIPFTETVRAVWYLNRLEWDHSFFDLETEKKLVLHLCHTQKNCPLTWPLHVKDTFVLFPYTYCK